jgi:hypothetical protein
MTERSSVAQISQIGVETVPGTPVAATRRLGSLIITPTIQAEVDMGKPEGSKFATTQVLNKEWATQDISGTPTYEEIIYPLSGAVDVATSVTQVMDGGTPTGAYEWIFSPDSFTPDAPKIFTLERGQDTVNVEKYSHLLFNAFGLQCSRSAVAQSGSAFSMAAVKGTSLTGALAIPAALTPITPGSVCVYLATTHALLDSAGASDPTKRLTRVINANPSIGDRFNPAWFVNCTVPSFTTFVEKTEGAGGQFTLTAEADTVGMGILDNLRAGDTLFVRVEATGADIYNAGTKPHLKYTLQWDMAIKIQAPNAFSDEDGIYAIGWTGVPVHDVTWGKSQSILVRNKASVL